jgi:uncharacterized membrane protein HdeD (DUF308 family)
VQLDREEQIEERNKKVAKFLRYFGVIMAIFYLVAGIAILNFPIIDALPDTMRYLVSGLFILYGIFRFYRALKK